MRVSIVIRSKDEAARLRLTLTSIARQSMAPEVVVVDDGSSDHTAEVLRDAQSRMALRVIRHSAPKGRSGASNAGAYMATGDVLLFMDGDTLAGPQAVAAHAAAHADGQAVVGRGDTLHIRATRFFRDPETGAPWPHDEARVAALPPREVAQALVTRTLIEEDFATIDRRAVPGIYPGWGPRRLYELERDALLHHPECTVLWAACSGHNFSVRRSLFLAAGGFDERLDINEHRELALRLTQRGARMRWVGQSRSYHLTHRTGWRDPVVDRRWETLFHAAHPDPSVKLLVVFWAGLDPARIVPAAARIGTLPELEAAARGERNVDYDDVRRGLFTAGVAAAGSPPVDAAGAQCELPSSAMS